MPEYHTAHARAADFSQNVHEIATLYRSLGMRSYLDGKYLSLGLKAPPGYDPRAHVATDIQRKKDEIDEILWSLAYNEVDGEPGSPSHIEAARTLARKYLNIPWLHTRWTTARILAQVLNSELVPTEQLSATRRVHVGLPLAGLLITLGAYLTGQVVLVTLAVAVVGWFGIQRYRWGRQTNQLHLIRSYLERIQKGWDPSNADLPVVGRHLLDAEYVGLQLDEICHVLLWRLYRVPNGD